MHIRMNNDNELKSVDFRIVKNLLITGTAVYGRYWPRPQGIVTDYSLWQTFLYLSYTVQMCKPRMTNIRRCVICARYDNRIERLLKIIGSSNYS